MVTVPEVAEVIEEWKAEVGQFLSRAETWLNEMDIPFQIERRPITINEQRSGPYDTEEMVVVTSLHHLTVKPIARWVGGGRGRVDLLGGGGRFIFIDDRERGGWNYLAERPIGHLYPLDGDLFRLLVASCLE